MITGKEWRQEHEAAVTVRLQAGSAEMQAGAQLAFPFLPFCFQSGVPTKREVLN